MIRLTYAFTNSADALTVKVWARPHDHAVTLTDDDAGITLPTVRHFPTEAAAVAHAVALVTGRRPAGR